MKDAADGFACFNDKCGGVVGNRQCRLDRPGGRQCLDVYDVLIVDWLIHWPGLSAREGGQYSEIPMKSLHEDMQHVDSLMFSASLFCSSLTVFPALW